MSTGQLGTIDAVLNSTHILADGANTTPPQVVDKVGELTIVITDVSSVIKDIIRNPSSPIALTQNASPGLFTPLATTTIVVTQLVDPGLLDTESENTLAMAVEAALQTSVFSTDAASVIAASTITESNFINLSASSTIVLVQDDNVGAPKPASASNAISATTTCDFTFGSFGRSALSDLNLGGTNPAGGVAESSIRNVQAETLNFTDTWVVAARVADTYELDVLNGIVLIDVLIPPTGKRSVEATNALSLDHFADHQLKSRFPVTTLVVNQTAAADKVTRAFTVLVMNTTAVNGSVFLDAESTLEFSQTVSPGPIDRDASNAITIVDTAISSITMLDANSSIAVTQDINVIRPYRISAASPISGVTDDVFIPPIGPIIPGVPFGLADVASFVLNPIRNPTNLINLSDPATVVHIRADAVDVTATTFVGINDDARLSITAEAVTSISTLQVDTNVNKNTTDAITPASLLQSAVFSILRANTPVDNSLNMKQSAGYSLVRDTTECDYTPFIGSSDADTTPPRPLLPEAGDPVLPGVRFRLAYPAFGSGTTIDTLDLRAPAFGNRERIDATRINRESFGGDLRIFSDPIWPNVHTLQMTFEGLKETQARGLLTFIERWLGQEIGIYDYEGRIWKGVITNPDEAITQDGINRFSANLEIEAERIHQLNRVALSNLGMTVLGSGGQENSSSTIVASQLASVDKFPVAPGATTVALANTAAYVKFPVGAGASALGLSGFSTRNSFFYKNVNSGISLSQIAASIDFADFGNLIHNWDAENTTGTASGSPLSSWADLGSVPVTLNAPVSNKPVARDSVLNGRRVIEFRHGSGLQRMTSASSVPLWDITNKLGTIFIVTIIRETLAGGNEIILGNNSDKIMLGGATSVERPVAFQTSEGTVTLETPQSVLADASVQLLVIKRVGNTVTFRRNKAAKAGTTLVANPTPANETLNFGGFSGAGNSVDQDIAQVLIYNDALSSSDILKVEGLLTAKWGV